jgi:PrtD family type I secretion system ABC transporter
MRDNLKSWFKYFAFISFFGMCINLIYLIVPIYMMVIYDRVLYSFSTATLLTLSILTICSLTVMGLLDYVRSKMLLQAGLDLEQRIMPQVITTMHKNAVAADKPGYSGALQDLMLFREAVSSFKIFKFLDLPWVIIYICILYIVHPLIGLVATIGLCMVGLFQFLLRSLNKKRYQSSSLGAAAGGQFLGATLRNAETISGMGMLDHVFKKFELADKKVQTNRYEAEANRCAVGAVKITLQALFTAGLFGTGAYLFFSNEITVGVMFASVIIMMRLFLPLDLSFESIKTSIEAISAYKRLTHFIEIKPSKTTLALPKPEGKLQAEGLTLAINNRTLLRNISFSLEPGETLGIFGPSSSGKTALVKMILGIWPASAGKMRLDGAEINQWEREDLGQHLGYVSQEIEFFSGTIGENIARLAMVDSEKVVLAAKKAFCHEMILKLPKGYDYLIDIRGKNLSCSQRRQIALARALYNDPQVIVMDEPHLNLDDTGLKALITTLQILKNEKKSVVIVTDRPNLLVTTDKLLMLKDGQVAIFGPSKEVLAKLTNPQQQANAQPRQQPQAAAVLEQTKQN